MLWARRRKYLLSGLLSCGQCGGNLTVAGKGARRRYYCANHKEKGKAVCTGMPGLSETDAAESILSGLRTGLMQDAAYGDFRKKFVEKVRAQEHETGEALRRHDDRIWETEKTHANLVRAGEGGTFSEALIERLNAVDAELKALRAEREALVPTPIDLPEDLPSLYRAYVADLASTLSDEVVAGAAADELHTLIDTVVVRWDDQKEHHELDIQGKLLELLSFADIKKAACLSTAACSLKLVAGVGFEPTTFRL
ncbi:zinc ribbon domain-containing protein [Sulfitobacter pontiacus]|uniref:zinc ribbon domain-containing protein n=2 Tax=Sulfitobacter TaxID=60136 RepID=UPI0030EF3673